MEHAKPHIRLEENVIQKAYTYANIDDSPLSDAAEDSPLSDEVDDSPISEADSDLTDKFEDKINEFQS